MSQGTEVTSDFNVYPLKDFKQCLLVASQNNEIELCGNHSVNGLFGRKHENLMRLEFLIRMSKHLNC